METLHGRTLQLLKENEALRDENRRAGERSAQARTGQDLTQNIIEKTKILELQTRVSQSDFDAQFQKLKCSNLENELETIRKEFRQLKTERAQLLEKISKGATQESILKQDCDDKTVRLGTSLLELAMVKSELSRLALKATCFTP